jgi:CheY-like chemotaxis protein
LSSGFDAHLSKPVDVDELVVIITALAAPGPI